ncbi:MAG TPA: aminoacyl--tRNA ligase-related protein, partial [Candidatus Paceibacterota bacterium]|nr:aminoacyl--tRNA ligase-related protein [Candidatus Paceibacterota bacterium]
HLTALQDKSLWEKTGRWSDEVLDIWFKTELKSGGELGLGTTHEEPLTALVKEYVRSYRDLPFFVYQFQTKFRNELRAKSGIMRGREFLMKDLYSFSRNQKEHEEFYEKAKQAYVNIFNRVGIGEKTYLTLASGGSFSKVSHEFQTISDAGEDVIYLSERKKIAINKEMLTDEIIEGAGLEKVTLVIKKAVEVGNIFSLGTKFSDALGLTYVDENEKKNSVIMGSYGIGVGRLMGTIVEVLSDDKGIAWPASVAPFKVHLIVIGEEGSNAMKEAETLYKVLADAGIETLFDDRDTRAGEKFADSDLIGIPLRIVISEKTLEKKMVEIKKRTEESAQLVSFEEAVSMAKAL